VDPKQSTVAVFTCQSVTCSSHHQVAGTQLCPASLAYATGHAESSTVVIDLQDQVPYEIHRLSSPDRILVDLHDTALVQELTTKNDVVDDALLSRIKIGRRSLA